MMRSLNLAPLLPAASVEPDFTFPVNACKPQSDR